MPVAQLGGNTNNALTFEMDQSPGADQPDAFQGCQVAEQVGGALLGLQGEGKGRKLDSHGARRAAVPWTHA